MALERIGALIVTGPGDERIVGIISERDIVRGMAEHGVAVLNMRVSGLMTYAVKTCAPHDSLKHVMVVMTLGRIRHLPVVDGSRLCGMVSIGDVVKNRLQEMELEVNVLRDACLAGRVALAS
jgi:CBS domain-containing protein